MLKNSKLDHSVIANFKNVKLWFLIPSCLLLILIYLYFILFNNGANSVDVYINVQKNLFFYLNHKLSEFPILEYNLTQLGDVLILFPLLTIFIMYAPKLWDALLTSALLSLIVSASLKKLFAVPRPAAMFDHDRFTIIGDILSGPTSLPSGHSMVAFIGITIVLFAFMPIKITYKIIWSTLMILLGFTITFSRVGVGAHYPLDVIIGSIIGFTVAIIGIKISNEVHLFGRIKNRKYRPIFILVLSVWGYFVVKKIMDTNLLIFYISLFSLLITIYSMTSSYAKKNN